MTYLFRITLKHNNKTSSTSLTSSTITGAIILAMQVENCPETAIINIKRVQEIK